MGSHHACHVQRPGLNPQRELERKSARKAVLLKALEERCLLPAGENLGRHITGAFTTFTTLLLALFHRPYIFSSQSATIKGSQLI